MKEYLNREKKDSICMQLPKTHVIFFEDRKWKNFW